MRPDFDVDPVPIDPFTPCPGCGEVGHTVQTWEHPEDGRPIQYMTCSKPRDECRVSNYYPNTVENAQ